MTTYKLREWRLDDDIALAKYADNPKIAANLRDVFPSPYRIEDARRYIRTCIDSSPARQLVYAIDVDGEAVGSAGLFRKEDVNQLTAEIGYWLGEPFWGKGIATDVIRELCLRGFKQYPIERIEAWVFAGNGASRKALAKNGFFCEGQLRQSVYKDHRLTDCCVYALLRGDFSARRQTDPAIPG